MLLPLSSQICKFYYFTSMFCCWNGFNQEMIWLHLQGSNFIFIFYILQGKENFTCKYSAVWKLSDSKGFNLISVTFLNQIWFCIYFQWILEEEPPNMNKPFNMNKYPLLLVINLVSYMFVLGLWNYRQL